MTLIKYKCNICNKKFVTLYRGGICRICRNTTDSNRLADRINARKEALRLFKEWYKYDPRKEGPPPEYEWFAENEKLSKYFKDRVAKTIVDNEYMLTLESLTERFGCDKSALIRIMHEYNLYEKQKANEHNRSWFCYDDISSNIKDSKFFNPWYSK